MNHHAYLYRAASKEASSLPRVYLTQSIDVVHIDAEVLTIGEVRALIVEAWRMPFESELRVFVVFAASIAHEAQQALLKILEEPPVTAQFHFVLPPTTSLLPTILSRLSLVPQSESLSDHSAENTPWVEFANMHYADRLAHVAGLTKAKDTVSILKILEGVEQLAHERSSYILTQAVMLVRSHMRSRGASLKMLLEHLALLLPVKNK